MLVFLEPRVNVTFIRRLFVSTVFYVRRGDRCSTGNLACVAFWEENEVFGWELGEQGSPRYLGWERSWARTEVPGCSLVGVLCQTSIPTGRLMQCLKFLTNPDKGGGAGRCVSDVPKEHEQATATQDHPPGSEAYEAGTEYLGRLPV